MRWLSITFLAAITCATGCAASKHDVEVAKPSVTGTAPSKHDVEVAKPSVTGTAPSKDDVEAAKHSVYEVGFAVIHRAVLEATRERYPNLEDSPDHGMIKTSWYQVSEGNRQDDLTNPQPVGNRQAPTAANPGAGGSRVAFFQRNKGYFIRFDISIVGGPPWQLNVVGHAAKWDAGQYLPAELHGAERPSWLEGRRDALIVSIHTRLKSYAVPIKDPRTDHQGDVKASDPAEVKGVLPPVAKEPATP